MLIHFYCPYSCGLCEKNVVCSGRCFCCSVIIQTLPACGFTEYMCHVYVRSDGLSSVLISDQEYPQRVAFSLLNKVCLNILFDHNYSYKCPCELLSPSTYTYYCHAMIASCRCSTWSLVFKLSVLLHFDKQYFRFLSDVHVPALTVFTWVTGRAFRW